VLHISLSQFLLKIGR